MKKIFLLLLLCMQIAAFAQQTPQYIFTPTPTYTYFIGGGYYTYGGPFGTKDRRGQTLYYPSEFSGMPNGYISRIYVKVGPLHPGGATDTSYYPHAYIGMKHFRAGEDGNDSSLYYDFDLIGVDWYDTDTVFYDSLYKIYTALSPGDWVGFTLQQPFLFDTATNFIVDFSALSRQPLYPNPSTLSTHLNPEHVLLQNTPANYIRYYDGGNQSPYDYVFGQEASMMVIGFDIQPLSSAPTVQTDKKMTVYPNPADDKLYIKNAKENASYEISDMTGKVLNKAMLQGNSSIDISELSPGLYLLRIDAQTIKFTKQ